MIRALIVLLLQVGSGVAPAVANTATVSRIGIEDAVAKGLENNRSLRVERYTPEIRRTREDRERARFDTGFSAETSAGRETGPTRVAGVDDLAGGGRTVAATDLEERTLRWTGARLNLERPMVTGTRIGAETSLRLDEAEGTADRYSTRWGLTATQALLRGAGVSVNRIGIRQAEIATRSSLHELHGFTVDLVARIEHAYWSLVLADRHVKIVRESAQLATQQLRDGERRVDAGVLASTELAAARSEAARRDEALIRAHGEYDRARLHLSYLLAPPRGRSWDLRWELIDEPPDIMPLPDDIADHVALALRLRAELNQAHLAYERGELDVVRTRNGMLPRLDLFVRLGRTGYAGSFGDALDALTDESPDLSGGLQLTHTIGRRAARADYHESQYLRQQAEAAVANLEALVELDVRTAHIDVRRADEQMVAAAATRMAHEETLRAETEKFRVGRSTALFVAQAQRDVMAARLAETEAHIAALKARIELYRLDGSLLERRGIVTPAGITHPIREAVIQQKEP